MKSVFYYDTPVGKIGIAENGEGITDVVFENKQSIEKFQLQETALLKEASKQLFEYFDGKRIAFDLSFELEGTEFEILVWTALLSIPYGETRSYGEFAKQIGKVNGSRAVGRANSKNPVAIFIPCHRVIGADGTLTGYAGGMEIKEKLLKLEGAI